MRATKLGVSPYCIATIEEILEESGAKSLESSVMVRRKANNAIGEIMRLYLFPSKD